MKWFGKRCRLVELGVEGNSVDHDQREVKRLIDYLECVSILDVRDCCWKVVVTGQEGEMRSVEQVLPYHNCCS